ncbi:LLM class F420-dependent oxidoreductase [Luteipulveratus sp. YIM 133132]|uniref:LLM class F420-dependent oxidoreductase n=1 Tax=Luteipulveratus flavus TaxID=3031728 RepID=UPI0023AF355F|nr:LLM class F420-dependent oxidoreductase [Luteipulveratus sp. YIM 133132]MDE9366515.1 LLM class F420-dependent oxidoreductase [Luteipulveratus sp. YIM 133132]
MRLGLTVGYWGSAKDSHTDAQLRLVQDAERVGYSVAWVAEAYGSDAPTILAWLGAQTSGIDLGSGIMQIPGRTPAMTAMTASTLDTLTNGRFRLGLGVSGPQVSEGWHGVRFGDPLGRTREYVEIVERALRRERLEYDGEHFTLPLPDGPGKALHLTTRPVRDRIPLYLAAVGPKNLRLTGELADGWLPVFYIPEQSADLHEAVRAGRESAGRGSDLTGFDIAPSVPVSMGEDLDAAYDRVRPYAALYVGGMGSAKQNFYNRIAVRAGFEEEAARVQQLYLDRKPREAAAALSRDFLDHTALIGPRERIAERLHRYADAGVTTLGVAPYADSADERTTVVRTMAELVEQEGLG